ncbi:MAG: hypothetical protein DI529_13225 [Chryseobacterium sp.]|nr:MAG: hypothetical protein DI529_13225 [Chryseobacterium sp.]
MTKKTTAFLIFLIFFIIYYAGSFSKISFGDCIGFVLDVEKREFITSATPLSHFLYMNTAIFLAKYFSMDSVTVMRFMSVVPGSLTVGLLYLFIKEFIKEDWIAVASSLIFGFGFSFWRSSETVEVYVFNALFVVLFLLLSVKSLKTNSLLNIVLSGFFLGLSFWVHIQNIMLIPAYILLLFYLRKNTKHIILSFTSFIILFAMMFYVNYLNNIELKYTFLTKQGPWVKDTFSQGFMDLVKDLIKAAAYLIYNFNIFVLFFVSGIIYLYKNYKTEFLFIFVAALFTCGFATFYAVSDNYVYFIPFYVIFVVFIGAGIKSLSSKYALKKLKFVPLFIPLFYIVCFYIVSLTPQGNQFHQKKLYKDGLRYYMLPWLNGNTGCIEFTLDHGKAEDNVEALKLATKEFIELRQKYQTLEEIREL